MPATRKCVECGRTFLQRGGQPAKRCPEHRKDSEGRYSTAHKRFRRENVHKYVGTPCSRCGDLMLAVSEMDLDHADDGAGYRDPPFSHSRCNQLAGARRKVEVVEVDPRIFDPEWARHFAQCVEEPRCKHSRPW